MASDDVAASGVDPPPSFAGDGALVSLTPASTGAPELPRGALASGSLDAPELPDAVLPVLGAPDAVDPDAVDPEIDAVDPEIGSLVPDEAVDIEPEPPLSPPLPEATSGVTLGLDAPAHPAESRKSTATGNESFMVDLDPKSRDGLNTAHGGRAPRLDGSSMVGRDAQEHRGL